MKCQKRRPRVSLESIVRIDSYNAPSINSYLVSNGPISVGICATDNNFIFYRSGIYNDKSCCVQQNHAMLVVGHGYDSQKGVYYWILRNSWGVSWGEKGKVDSFIVYIYGIWGVYYVGVYIIGYMRIFRSYANGNDAMDYSAGTVANL